MLGASALNASTTNSYGLTVNANTGAQNNYAAQFLGGNVGIGTSSPLAARLEVWGSDTASTSAFAVVNSASTTVLSVLDNGNATLSGNLIQNSDQRLKTNVQSLDASSSLSLIDQLNPVTFYWIDPDRGTAPQLGFIAQQVFPIFPDLISTTSPTALTPDGTLGLNYTGLIAPIVRAIQALSAEITSIENTIAGFADSFTTKELTFNRATGKQLCLQKSDGSPVCVTGDQLAGVLAGTNAPPTTPVPSGSSATPAPATAPVIHVNGDNPASIHLGDAYSDLGATITGPQADLDLGIQTFVNGTAMSPIQIDTSQAATDTIDYVVTDQNGMTSTSSRTVIIESLSTAPTGNASSASDTAASTTEETSTTTTP